MGYQPAQDSDINLLADQLWRNAVAAPQEGHADRTAAEILGTDSRVGVAVLEQLAHREHVLRSNRQARSRQRETGQSGDKQSSRHRFAPVSPARWRSIAAFPALPQHFD